MVAQVSIPGNFNIGNQPAFPGGMPPAALPATTGGGVPPTGLLGFEQAISGGLGGALQTLGGGLGAAQREIDIGNIGLEGQAAFGGLRGPEAQAEAFAGFQASPGQQFLQQEAERALLRNEAAVGGLGGGNVLRELQRQAIGLAQQDFSNQCQRGQQVLGSQQASARDLANLSSQCCVLGSQLISGAGQDIGGARFTTGQGLAQAAGGTTTALANLQNQLGLGQANVFGQGTTNLANLVGGTGQVSGQVSQDLGTVLANIGTGQASNLVQPTLLQGAFQAQTIQNQNAAVQNILEQLLELS